MDEGRGAASGHLSFAHTPVLLEAVCELLGSVPPGVLVDATLGGGGHAAALLSRDPSRLLVGLDVDADALAAAAGALGESLARATLVRSNFACAGEVLADLGVGGVAGALVDLGVSSPQLERAERGFSFHRDGPLDMRMDDRLPLDAASLVNRLSRDELVALLERGGEDRFAERIARAIVSARPFARTGALAAAVAAAVPAAARRRSGHPARRTFQALRIEVNDELGALRRGLVQLFDALVPGGRLVVLTYHSGEDRIVKRFFELQVRGGCECPPGLPCACGAVPAARVVGRRLRRPTEAEELRNPRSRSVHLRALERLEQEGRP